MGGRDPTQLKPAPSGSQEPRIPWVTAPAGPEQGLMGAALLCAERRMPLFLRQHSVNLRNRYVCYSATAGTFHNYDMIMIIIFELSCGSYSRAWR